MASTEQRTGRNEIAFRPADALYERIRVEAVKRRKSIQDFCLEMTAYYFEGRERGLIPRKAKGNGKP